MVDVYVTRRFYTEATMRLAAAGHTTEINDSSRIMSSSELIQKGKGKDALICLLNDRIDATFLDECPTLRIVANVAVGYDNIDVEGATERNVMVTNTPGVLTEAVADLTFALLLSAARRIPEGDRYIRAGEYKGWELMQPQVGVNVFGKTLGIVGMGRIGTAVARRAYFGFGMQILYTDPQPHSETEKEMGAERVDLETLLEQSDFVSLHAALTPQTYHIIGSAELNRMRKTAILVNVARGALVDEEALVRALKASQILGAAIDVYEREPEVHIGLSSATSFTALAPHLGSATRETRLKMAHMAVDNVLAALDGKTPPNLVNPDVKLGEKI